MEKEEKLFEAKTFYQKTDRRGDQSSKHSEGGIPEQSGRHLPRLLPRHVPPLQSRKSD